MKNKLFIILTTIMVILPVCTYAKSDVKFECDKTELAKNETITCVFSGSTNSNNVKIKGTLDNVGIKKDFDIYYYDELIELENEYITLSCPVSGNKFSSGKFVLINKSDKKGTTKFKFNDVKILTDDEKEEDIGDFEVTVNLLGDNGLEEPKIPFNKEELLDNDKQDNETTEESSESTGDVVENPKTGVSDNVYLLVIAMAVLGLTIIVSRNFKFFRKLK